MFYPLSKDDQSEHFVSSLIHRFLKPPFYVSLSSKRPMHAFKSDGSHNRHRDCDNCAARKRPGNSERNGPRFPPTKILYRVFHPRLQEKDAFAREDP
ncbi:hypothetical protein PSHT_07489 [Puccinia striiformis]|uniref:Uncharacterized protein n=3 Tax=Puccinia striiformis TaxID=27350 RepID=A0A0L0VBM0_9BASI|nr:hypothetical protein H4Q26_007885 [Puccinia striiformis f. sp. tritici PST-130]KNE96675.1 hypothetical protein PSTG_10080 [Puccinia striiformis f. sp. tritici PST-78]POW07860.1 hypothetical protein PSTT_07943 [Puccinia striiformis]POW14193.1 hypothetical protein PSHT_07489 [Puccinia striiformis]